MKQELEIPTIQGLSNTLNRINNIRDKALITFLYLTGARVSEVVFRFKVGDISTNNEQGKLYYIFNIFTEKRRTKEKGIYRRLPVPYETNKDMVDTLLDYIRRYQLKDTSLMFELNRRTVHLITKKWLGIHPHFLRHIRLSHLTSFNGFTEQELKQFAGWSDSRPASIYVHLNWRNLSHKL